MPHGRDPDNGLGFGVIRGLYMTVVSDSHYQSTFDAVYVYVVPRSEFPIVPSYPHPQIVVYRLGCTEREEEGRQVGRGVLAMPHARDRD